MNLNYAGIGARALQQDQHDLVIRCARYLAQRDYVVHSGAAEGTDQLFSNAAVEAGGSTVLHLPWKKHADDYVASLSGEQLTRIETRVLQAKRNRRDVEAFASVDQHHPAAEQLSWGARLLHARNYRIVVPEQPVAFVLALPSHHAGKAVGGTMQGIRLATALSIPVIRLDRLNWTQVEAELVRLVHPGLWG